MTNSSIRYFRNKESPASELAIGLVFKPVKTWLVLWKVPLRKTRLNLVAFNWTQLLCEGEVIAIGTKLSRKLILQSNPLNKRFEYCNSYLFPNKKLCITSLKKPTIPAIQMPLLIS